MTWLTVAKLAALVFVCAVAVVIVARLLVRQALRAVVERERMDRALDAAKKDEEARAAKAAKAIADDKAARDAKIDDMNAKELEREVNK